MKTLILPLVLALPLCAQEYKIAVIGLVHSHVWGHLPKMAKGESAKLVGIAEPNQELIAEAKKIAPDAPYYDDYKKMLEEQKPDIVWSFVENNRQLEIVRACAPRKINVMFEKPLASTGKEAEEIRSLARQHGIQVMSNYQMAWWPANYTAKAAVDAGKIGKPWRLHGICRRRGVAVEFRRRCLYTGVLAYGILYRQPGLDRGNLWPHVLRQKRRAHAPVAARDDRS